MVLGKANSQPFIPEFYGIVPFLSHMLNLTGIRSCDSIFHPKNHLSFSVYGQNAKKRILKTSLYPYKFSSPNLRRRTKFPYNRDFPPLKCGSNLKKLPLRLICIKFDQGKFIF